MTLTAETIAAQVDHLQAAEASAQETQALYKAVEEKKPDEDEILPGDVRTVLKTETTEEELAVIAQFDPYTRMVNDLYHVVVGHGRAQVAPRTMSYYVQRYERMLRVLYEKSPTGFYVAEAGRILHKAGLTTTPKQATGALRYMIEKNVIEFKMHVFVASGKSSLYRFTRETLLLLDLPLLKDEPTTD